jgi:hypothetical protein
MFSLFQAYIVHGSAVVDLRSHIIQLVTFPAPMLRELFLKSIDSEIQEYIYKSRIIKRIVVHTE